ncbi:hypothetical protein AGIG_G6005 [Arapaima gigas]
MGHLHRDSPTKRLQLQDLVIIWYMSLPRWPKSPYKSHFISSPTVMLPATTSIGQLTPIPGATARTATNSQQLNICRGPLSRLRLNVIFLCTTYLLLLLQNAVNNPRQDKQEPG